jgi:hypothetical protein
MNIHKLILQKIDDENAGKYRNVPVAMLVLMLSYLIRLKYLS